MSLKSIDPLWLNVAAGIIVLALGAVSTAAYERLTNSNPLYRRLRISIIGVVWFVLNATCIYFFPTSAALFTIISSVGLAWVMFVELDQYWRIGLVGADRQIRTGIDVRDALTLVSTSLDFLGIGAAKLSAERTAFEAAISRCDNPQRPVRFLLCRPDSDRLQQIAQSAERDRTLFQKRVRESLRVIANLKTQRAWNIEVKFYRDFPTFRLMFIDDSICLVSHYVLGKGLDIELPQLHVLRVQGHRDVDSLYYAFSSYFERYWKEAEAWDFLRYLDES